MVQRVWRQIEEMGLADHTYMVTGKSQSEMMQLQIHPSVPIIYEPERRDTFAAILLAATYLHSHTETNPDETVIIMPVDPYVEGDFFRSLLKLDRLIQEHDVPLGLIGAQPAHPSEKYGYILTEQTLSDSESRKVLRFVEKPKEAVAAELIREGALWNCGVFAGKLQFFLQLLNDRGYPIAFKELSARYSDIKKISFDYEVVEQLDQVEVLPYHGYWKDLGTWNTLTEEMKDPVSGIGRMSADSVNCHVLNELDIPVALLGVSNLVVAASPDGILVTDKDSSPRIKEILSQEAERPMYVERYWGWYRVLEYGRNEEGQEVLIRRVCIHEGNNLSYHYHLNRQESWTITSGSGEVVIGQELRSVKSGDVVTIPPDIFHSIKATTELYFIETQIGSELVEEDIYRVAHVWDDVLRHISDNR